MSKNGAPCPESNASRPGIRRQIGGLPPNAFVARSSDDTEPPVRVLPFPCSPVSGRRPSIPALADFSPCSRLSSAFHRPLRPFPVSSPGSASVLSIPFTAKHFCFGPNLHGITPIFATLIVNRTISGRGMPAIPESGAATPLESGYYWLTSMFSAVCSR